MGALEVSGVPGLTPSLTSNRLHTMDLLLDVELAVSVPFGRTELPIKEILS
jgi:flagellar motor switch/type III secretory pathway protein FliN